VVGACSPSLGLLLHRAERSADPACAQEHRDERQDELVREVVRQGLHRGDAVRSAPSAWGASDDVRRDVAADAAHRLPAHLAAVGAGKWAGRARDVPEQAVLLPPELLEQVPADAVVLCIQDAARSAARSCAVQASAARMRREEQLDGAVLGLKRPMVERMQKLSARLVEQPPLKAAEVAQPTGAGAQPQLEIQVAQVALLVQQAFQPRA